MMVRLASRIGCTEGQAWTLALAALLGVVSVAVGLPPAFRGGEVLSDAAASFPAPDTPRIGPDETETPTLATLVEPPATAPADDIGGDADLVALPPQPVRDIGAPIGSSGVDASPSAPAPAPDAEAPTTSPAPGEVAPVPLTIADFGWASARGGTPIARAEVAEGTLPVGARAGIIDELSFVRLRGTATTLRLTEADTTLTAAVRACPITDPAWEPVENVALEDAPAYDCRRGVPGVPDADGTWSFDLAGQPDRSGPAGFALVPAQDAGTFRIRYGSS